MNTLHLAVRRVGVARIEGRLVLASVLAVAALLRFIEIGEASYWRDEVFSVDLVRLPFGSMLRGVVRTEGTPPLYYAAAWVWRRVFGTHEAALRSLSALFGVAAVAALYLAALRLFGRRAATLTGAVAATSPLLVWYSQEARSYELGLFLVSASFAALASIRAGGASTAAIATWSASACAALATHYFTVFVVVPEAVWLVALSRHAMRRALVAIVPVAATGIALVPLVLAQRGNPDWIAGRPLARRALQVPSEFLAGPEPEVAAFAVPLLALIGYGVWRARRHRPGAAAGVAAVGVAGVLVPLVLAAAGTDFFLARNVVFSWPFLAAAVAAALAASRAGTVAAAVVVVINLVIVGITAGHPKYGSEDWRAVAAAVGRPTVPKAYVVSPLEGEKAFRYYRPHAEQTTAAAVRVREVDVVALPPPEHPLGRAAHPPWPVRPLPLPGFRVSATAHERTFTLVRYVAPRARSVSAGALRRLALETSAELLVEPPEHVTPEAPQPR